MLILSNIQFIQPWWTRRDVSKAAAALVVSVGERPVFTGSQISSKLRIFGLHL
jgi:hypothetical protein